MAWKPDYATLAEGRTFLRITDATDTADDTTITRAITAASRGVDRATNRQFGVLTTAAARYYTPRWDADRAGYVVAIDDLMTTTSLVVKADMDGDGVYEETITDYTLLPRNAAADGKPWTEILFGSEAIVCGTEGSLEATALWGWTAFPATIVQASLLQMSRLLKRRDSPFGVAGSPDMGSELRLLAKLDPDVELLCADFRRWWG